MQSGWGRRGDMWEGVEPNSRSLLGWAGFGSHSRVFLLPPEIRKKDRRQTCLLFKKEVWPRDLFSEMMAKDSRWSTH